MRRLSLACCKLRIDEFTQQQHYLLGGDLQISQRKSITDEQLNWLSTNAQGSRVIELHTMLGTPNGNITAVERQHLVYKATVLHAPGTRTSVVLKSIVFKYALLIVVLSSFSLLVGATDAQTTLSS